MGGWVGGGGVWVWVCGWEVGARFLCSRAVTEATGKEMKCPPSAPSEKSMFVGSGERMVARLRLKEIDRRAPPGVASVALFDTTREKLTRFGHGKDGQIESSFLTCA